MKLGTETRSNSALEQYRPFQKDLARGLKAAAFSLLITTAWVAPAGEALAQQYQFGAVQINGNERIGDSAILSQAGIARGQTVSAGQLNDAFQRLNDLGSSRRSRSFRRATRW